MRILLADPSRFGLKMLDRLLSERGHRVTGVLDGLAALSTLRTTPEIEVLITSFELDGLGGLELCWEARALAAAEQRALYVIALSSNHDEDHVVEALDSGADDFIRKPPRPAELFARLRSAERINQAQRDLIRLANIDPLTGLNNRRAFFERATRLTETAHSAAPVATLMIDIDHFKRVNDDFGHDIGDIVIRQIADLVRGMDGLSGRLGGEEFACILPNCDATNAQAAAERLRLAAIDQSVQAGSIIFGVTLSIGLSVITEPMPVDQALKQADVALYQAKRNGRNCIVGDGRAAISEARELAMQTG